MSAKDELLSRITLEPGKRGGKPCIRRLRITVQFDQPPHDQLTHDAQRVGQFGPSCRQAGIRLLHQRAHRSSFRQNKKVIRIAALQALLETRVIGQQGRGSGVSG